MTGNPALFGALTGASWMALFAIGHLSALRVTGRGAAPLIASFAAAATGCVVTVVGTLADTPQVLGLSFAVLTFTCLLILYVPAVYVIQTSVSVDTIVELARRHGVTPTEDLYGRFAGRAAAERRLATLCSNGYALMDGLTYRITPRGRSIAKISRAVKRFWRLGSGG